MSSGGIIDVDLNVAAFEHCVNIASLALARDGVVKISNACDSLLIDQWRNHFDNFILRQVASGKFPYRIASLGFRRNHFILEIQQQLNSPAFYAIPIIYTIAKKMLDDQFFLATAAIADAESGSIAQYIHRDQPMLFPGHRVNEIIPSVSLTVSIPLVETNELVGGTEFQLGSHHANASSLPFVHSNTKKGDCLIWDSRVMHRGMPNNGMKSRPIVLLYYQRPWFYNFLNYSKDVEIKISDSELARVPDQYRHLFDWVRKIWPPPVYDSDAYGLCACGSGLLFSVCHGRR